MELHESEIGLLTRAGIIAPGMNGFKLADADRQELNRVRAKGIERLQENLFGEIKETHKNLIDYIDYFKIDGELYKKITDMLATDPATASLKPEEKKLMLESIGKFVALQKEVEGFIEAFKKFDQEADPAKRLKIFNEEVFAKFDILSKSMIDYCTFFATSNINQIVVPEALNDEIKKAISRTTSTAIGFQDYIIKPVQTGLKYTLFAREMGNIAKEGEPFFKVYAEFGKKAKTIGDKANAAVKEAEAKAKAAVAGAATVATPVAGGQAVAPKPVKNIALGDLVVSTELFGTGDEVKTTRKSAKELLKKTEFEGWKIEQLKKGVGIKREFYILDKDNNHVCKVTIIKGRITVTQAEGASIESIHQFTHQLRMRLPNTKLEQPKITSTNVDTIVQLTQKGLNITFGETMYYSLGTKEAKLVTNKITEAQNQEIVTHQKAIPVVSIEPKEGIIPAGTPDNVVASLRKQEGQKIKEKFQKVLSMGLLVPQLKGGAQGNFEAGEEKPTSLEISTTIPLLALKQFEAVLAAGFTPHLTPKAKEAVQNYVNSQVKANLKDKLADTTKDFPTERQINISGPLNPDGTTINGKEVLERIKIAAENGFIVNVDPKAKEALIAYLKSSPNAAADFSVKIPKVTEPVMLIRNLVELGIIPFNADLEKEIKDSIKNANQLPIVTVNSGSLQQDLMVMQQCIGIRGMRVNVEHPDELKKHIGNVGGPCPLINLQFVDPAQQIEQAQKLALMGINSKLSVPVPPDIVFNISSDNPKHAIAIFQTALNQGFKPQFGKTKQLVHEYLQKEDTKIRLESKDPILLFEQVQQCMKEGLIPGLTEPQLAALQKYARKNNLILEVSGFTGSAVRENIELASKIGANMLSVSEDAQRAYFMEQKGNIAERKGNESIEQHVTAITIQPQMTTKSRFLLGDKTVVDLDKTIKQAMYLQKLGMAVDISNLTELVTQAQANENKRSFFGFGGPTKEAKESVEFLKQVKLVEYKNRDNKKDIQVSIKKFDIPKSFGQKSTSTVAPVPGADGERRSPGVHPLASKAVSESKTPVAGAKAGAKDDDDRKNKLGG